MFRKIKCYFGFHDIDGPTKVEIESFYYCKGECGSYVRWAGGVPRYGAWATFGKLKLFMVTVEVKDVAPSKN